MNRKELGEKLDNMVARFTVDSYVRNDPLGEVEKFESARDREAAAFIASGFAFGGIKNILAHLRKIWNITGKSPFSFAIAYRHVETSNPFSCLKYRWIDDDATSAIFHVLGEMLRKCGSLEKFFAISESGPLDLRIESFCKRALELSPRDLDSGNKRGLAYFFSSPGTSACKRLNLFLRWVVRDAPPDLGLWDCLSPSELVIPLDIHIARAAVSLGLTTRKSKDWKAAVEITESLKEFDPRDPLKYDFALHKLGVTGGDTDDF